MRITKLIAAIGVPLALLLTVFGYIPQAQAASWTYKAPSTIKATNIGSTFVELQWATITGAPSYRIKAVGGGTTKIQSQGPEGFGQVTGLKKNTKYTFYVQVEMPGSKPKAMSAWSKASATVTTKNYTTPAPTNLKVIQQGSRALAVSWNGFTPGDGYRIRFDLGLDQALKVKHVTRYANTMPADITGLAVNSTYYIRATIVTYPGNKIVSDSSTYVVGKTFSRWGYIEGQVNGAPAKNVVAIVYKTTKQCSAASRLGEIVSQTNIRSDGSYRVKVRPGNYCLELAYRGRDGYASAWASGRIALLTLAEAGASPVLREDAADDGGRTYREVKMIAVAEDKVSVAKPLEMQLGGSISGTIKVKGKSAGNIAVSATPAWNTSKTIVDQMVTSNNGQFTLKGLPSGEYIVRMNYTGSNYTALKSVRITLSAQEQVTMSASSTLLTPKK